MHERIVFIARLGYPKAENAAAIQDCGHSTGGGELQFQGAVFIREKLWLWNHA